MEPSSVIDDAEFWLPPEFLTDDDFLVEKENNGVGIDDSLFPYEPRHGFGSTVRPKTVKEDDEESFLAGLTQQMVKSSLEDAFSGGFCGNHAFPAGNDNKVVRFRPKTNFVLYRLCFSSIFDFFGGFIVFFSWFYRRGE